MFADPTAPDTPWSQPWTLASPLRFEGVGVHSGLPVTLSLMPAAAGHGLVFYRVDLPGTPAVPARADLVSETALSTTLAIGTARVGTVEHLLAALWGCGVSDARIELDGCEVPIMDGSALPFVEAILATGIKVLEGYRRLLLPAQTTTTVGECALAFIPDTVCRVSYAVDFNHPLAPPQLFSNVITPAFFVKEIAPARTFGFLRDVEAMRQAGLAKGGSFDNALVISDAGYSSPLRFKDELVRHKVLDLLGDLALLGGFWRGHVLASKAGHALHNRLARQLVLNASSRMELAV